MENIQNIIYKLSVDGDKMVIKALNDIKSAAQSGATGITPLNEAVKQMGTNIVGATAGMAKMQTGLKEVTVDQQKAKIATQQNNREIQLQAKLAMSATDSYNAMSAQMAINTIKLHQYTLEETKSNEEAIRLIATNKKLQESMLAIDAAQGKFGRNVGNYQNINEYLNSLHHQEKNSGSGGIFGMGSTVTSGSMGFSTLTSEMGFVTKGMQEMAAAGKMDSEEFRILAARAAELKEQMAGVGLAVERAAAQSERGALMMEKAGEALKEFGLMIVGMVGMQLGMEFIAGIAEEFGQADNAARQLANTLDMMGESQALGRLNEQAEKLSLQFEYLDKYSIQNVYTKLLSYGKLNEKQMNDLMPVIINFAAKTGQTVEESSAVIIKAMEGNARGLKMFGINIKDAATEAGQAATTMDRYNLIMKELPQRVEGAATAFGEGFKGKLEGVKKGFREVELAISDFFVRMSGVEETGHKNANAANEEAKSATKLKDEYNLLSAKVDKTEKDKQRLKDITIELSTILGVSAMDIDKETGAYSANIKKIDELIAKRQLLSDVDTQGFVREWKMAEEGIEKLKEDANKLDILNDEAIKKVKEYQKNKLFPVIENPNSTASERNKALLGGSKIEAEAALTKKNLEDIYDKMDELEKKKISAHIRLTNKNYSAKEIDDMLSKPETDIKARDDSGGKKLAKLLEYNGDELAKVIDDLNTQRITKEMDLQKQIGDNINNSLDDRIQAYKGYYENMNNLAKSETEKEIKLIETKKTDLLKSKKAGTTSQKDFDLMSLTYGLEEDAAKDKLAVLIQKNGIAQTAEIAKINNDQIKILNDKIQKAQTANQTAADNELLALSEKYAKGLILEEEYQKKKAEIINKSQKDFINDTIKAIDDEIVNSTLDSATKDKLREELAQYKKKQLDNLIKGNEDSAKKPKDKNNELQQQALQAGLDITQQFVNSEIAIWEKRDAYKEEMAQRNLDWNKRMLDNTVQSNHEKQANDKAMYIAEMQLNKQKMQDDKKRAEAQAELDYGIAATALIAKAMVDRSNPTVIGTMASLAISEIVLAATFASKMALLESAPVYGFGTDLHPGGAAIVGDRNEKELIKIGNQMFLSPDKATAMNLPAGAKVIPPISASNYSGMGGNNLHAPQVNFNNQNQSHDFSKMESMIMKMGVAISNMQVVLNTPELTRQQGKDYYSKNVSL